MSRTKRCRRAFSFDLALANRSSSAVGAFFPSPPSSPDERKLRFRVSVRVLL